ncbi:hypothetical protein I5F07_18355 [Proteus vulgaris]|uniref:hypothetical protein n=1 Tax=Proteus vulgaris TaxID=585 RepID=UPI001868C205|nr:hypothetical protein [Proteus vulgaris]MBG5986812.1 hypothetical protein [Proteus vulgaris]MCH4257187.1 hypothetical protein [Proteus vulgaris]MDM3564221.1 hypothetical protein [Proteus vulgaris]
MRLVQPLGGMLLKYSYNIVSLNVALATIFLLLLFFSQFKIKRAPETFILVD